MSNKDNNCTPNGIMLVGIATLLGTPLRHAYLRSGGTTGALVFERMVEDGRGVACAVRPFTMMTTTTTTTTGSGSINIYSGGGVEVFNSTISSIPKRLIRIPPLCILPPLPSYSKEEDDVDDRQDDDIENDDTSVLPSYSPTSSLFVPTHLKNILFIRPFLNSTTSARRQHTRSNFLLVPRQQPQQQYWVDTLLLHDGLCKVVFPGVDPTRLGLSFKVLPHRLEMIGESAILNDLIVLLRPRVLSQSKGPCWEEGLSIPLTFNAAAVIDDDDDDSTLSSTDVVGEGNGRGDDEGGTTTATISSPLLPPATKSKMRAQTTTCEEILLPNLSSPPYLRTTTIPSNYLSGFHNLSSIDLASFEHVTSILGGSFLKNSIRLKEVNLTPLKNLEDCGSLFLAGCCSLTQVDLSSLGQLKVVKSSFLFGCANITPTINLHALHRLTTISPHFLSACSGLVYLDLSPFCKVMSIGSYFMSGCSGLESIDLTPLSNVTSIGSDFMSRCSMLSRIDITPLTNTNDALRVVPPRFLARTGLTTLDLLPLRTITSVIGEDFLGGCTSLTTIDLSPLQHSVVEVHKGFLGGCTLLLPPIGDISIALPNAEIHYT